MNRFFVFISLFVFLSSKLFAQAGSLDNTFSSGTGAEWLVKTIGIQSSGKIIIGGYFTTYNGVTSRRIARLNSNGTFDATFNIGASFSDGTGVESISIQSDDKIIVGGGFNTFNGNSRNRIARLNVDGTLDASFNPGTGVVNTVFTTSVQSDSKVIIGGVFDSYNGTARNCIARLNTDGSLDATFNPGSGVPLPNNILVSKIQTDNKILIGGSFPTYNGSSRNNLARVNIDGTLDATFNIGTGTNGWIYTISLQTDGKIIIGGNFTSYNGTAVNRIARLNTDGSLDATFNSGTGATGIVYTSSVQSNGKIVIAGDITNYNSIAVNRIVRLNSDGSLDATFISGTGANSGILASNIQSDGKIIIGGDFTTYNGTSINRIARLLSVTPCSSYTANLSGTATICSGSSTNLTFNLTGGTSPYSVTYSDGTTNTTISNVTNGQTLSVSPTTTKTYTIVSATDANSCAATVGSDATITVTPLCSPNASGDIFVTNTNDSGCGSLREAINCANSTPGANTIKFAITGLSPYIIGLNSGLPEITDNGTIIDATSQSGWYLGMIVLQMNSQINFTSMLFINTASDCAIYGLHIRNNYCNNCNGIRVGKNTNIGALNKENLFNDLNVAMLLSDNPIVTYNLIGTNSLGNSVGNTRNTTLNVVGILAGGQANATINNNILGAYGTGIIAFDNSRIFDNFIGVDKTGLINIAGNMTIGISLAHNTKNTGSVVTGNKIFNCGFGIKVSDDNAVISDNEIAKSQWYGIHVTGSNLRFKNKFSQNKIYCNLLSGIILDAGTNNSIQKPVILAANPNSIKGTTIGNQTIEVFYSDNTGCSSAPCQGKTYLGTTTADATGNWTLNGSFVLGSQITATGTDTQNNTSEFATCTTVALCTSATTPSVSATKSTICTGENTTLTATGTLNGATDWYWYTSNCGSTPAGSGLSITVSPSAMTTYYVRGEGGGCTNGSCGQVTITVNTTPTAPTAGTPTQPTCSTPTGSVTLSGLPSGSWTINPGSITGNTSTRTITGLAEGTYNFTVTNAAGCTSAASSSITINAAPIPPTLPSVSSSQPAVCNDEIVRLTANGELNSATDWYWYTGSCGETFIGTGTSIDVTQMATTTYYVRAEGGSCPNSDCAFGTIIFKTSPTANISGTLSFCSGSSTTLTASGGDTYQWTDGSTSNPLTVSSAGTYFVTVTGSNGCTATTSANVTQITTSAPPTTTVTYCQNATATPLSTTGSNLLWYTNPTGGTGNTTAPTPSTTTVGTVNYYVTQTANGCQSSRTAIPVTVKATPSAPTATNKAYCQNTTASPLSASGSSLLWYGTNPTGGTGSSTAPTPSTTTVGTATYYVSQTVNGCESPRKAITVTVNPLPVMANPSVTDVKCRGNSDGIVNISASGGTQPIDFSISPFAGSQSLGTFTDLPIGNYTFTATDANSCTATQSVTIGQPATVVSFSPLSVKAVKCNGGNDGEITLSASGGTGAITITTNPTITPTSPGLYQNLTARTYVFTATDANNCTTTTSVMVTEPTALNMSTGTVTNILCNGSSTGQIPVTISGGTANYQIDYQKGSGAITSLPSSAAATQTLTGLSAGTYNITVTDANGCKKVIATTLTEPSSAVIATQTAITQVSCQGGVTGSVTLSATGGTSPYVFARSAGISNTTGNFTGLSAGTFTVTITDANSCVTTKSVTITEPSALIASISLPKNVTCPSGNDGGFQINASGGTPLAGNQYSYAYGLSSGGSTSLGSAVSPKSTGNILSAGAYRVTVTDGNGCLTNTLVQTITQPAAFAFSSNTVNPTACSSATGSANFTVSGGSGTYTSIVLKNGAGASITTTGSGASRSATALAAGNYSVDIVDDKNCAATLSFVVNSATSSVVLNTPSVTDVKCKGGNTGKISLTATNANAVSFAISSRTGQQTTGVFDNLTAGNYTVTAFDVNGCTAFKDITVNEPATAVVFSNSTITDVKCKNGKDGKVVLSAIGGTGTLTYSMNAPIIGRQNGNTFDSLTAATHTFTATDMNGCTTTTSVIVKEPSIGLSFSTPSVKNVNCKDGNDGKVTLSASGGTLPFVFSINPNTGIQSPSGTFDSLTARTYTFTATDNNNCTAMTTATVSQPSTAVTLADPSVINIKCNGGNTGQITALANGGTGSLVYETNPILTPSTGTFTGVFTGVTAQNYTVIAKDANGCKASKNIVVTQPAPLNVSVGTLTNVFCAGGSTGQIPLTISGGTPAYKIDYQRNSGATMSLTGVSNLTNLSAGIYSISLTDANNCTTATAIPNQVITQAPPFSLNIVSKTDANCGVNNGAITFNINGGSTNYTSTIVKLGATVLQNYTSGTNLTQRTLTALAGGTYTVIVIDNNNCTDTLTFAIAAASSIVLTSATPVATTCFDKTDGKITIIASGGTGGLSYSVNGIDFLPNNVFSNLAAATYNVTVKDGDGCTATKSVIINKPSAIIFSTPSVSNVKCKDGNDGKIVLSASGGTNGVTLTINPIIGLRSVDTFKNLTANTYVFMAKDGNNCVVTQSLTVSQPNTALVLANPSLTNIKCFGGTDGQITASATGGTGQIKYSISSTTINQQNTIGTFLNLTAQTYMVTAVDSNSCSDSKPAIITSPNKLTNSFTTSYSTICTQGSGNGKVNTTVTGGTTPYKFLWSNGAITDSIGNLAVGTYIVTVTDNNNCTAIDSAKITCVPITYTLTFSTDSTRCFGDSTGVLHFSPSGNTQTATNGAPYTYVWQSATNPNLRGSGSILSNGEMITVSNLPAGKYDVTIADALNVLPKTASITIYSLPRLSLGNPTIVHPKCYGDQNGRLQFSNITGGTIPYRFVWSNGATTPSVSNLVAGTFRVSVIDQNSCQDTASVTLRTDPILIGTKNTTAASCMGVANGSVAVSNISGGTPTNGNYTFRWANNTTNTGVNGTLSNLAVGSYRFTVSDANACPKVDSFQITALRTLQLSSTINNITCYGLRNGRISATVSAIGTPKSPYTFTWSGSVGTPTNAGNTTTVNALTAGSYPLSIKDADGCSLDSVFTITQPTDIQLGATTIKNETCTVGKDGQIASTVSGGSSPYTYLWSNSSTSATVSNLVKGAYTLSITDVMGCKKSKEFIVGYTADEYPKPDISATNITPTSITFTWVAVPNAIKYNIRVDTNAWKSVDSNVLQYTVDSLKEKTNVKFSVQAVGRNSCNALISNLTAQTAEEPVNIQCLTTLKEKIPNAISVNNDAQNEIFQPLNYLNLAQCGDKIRVHAERLLIVNQWGEIIYETSEKDNSGNCICQWDGHSQKHTKPVPEGAYFYVLVFNVEGKQHQVRGTINVFTNQ